MLSFRSRFIATRGSFPLLTNDTLIAPFLDDVDITSHGEIFFRFSVDETLLNEVAFNISQAFGTNFSPSSLFIATWNAVAAYGRLSTIVSQSWSQLF